MFFDHHIMLNIQTCLIYKGEDFYTGYVNRIFNTNNVNDSNVLCTHPHELHGHQFESLGLETFDNFADESTLHAVRLDHDESTFSIWVTHD